MNKDIIINDLEKSKTKMNVIKSDKYKFRRSTVIYNFIDFIVKNVYLMNDYLDAESEIGSETE